MNKVCIYTYVLINQHNIYSNLFWSHYDDTFLDKKLDLEV